jgi:hypothetical protein
VGELCSAGVVFSLRPGVWSLIRALEIGNPEVSGVRNTWI